MHAANVQVLHAHSSPFHDQRTCVVAYSIDRDSSCREVKAQPVALLSTPLQSVQSIPLDDTIVGHWLELNVSAIKVLMMYLYMHL